MNHHTTRPVASVFAAGHRRLASLALASLLTWVMLISINSLATADHRDPRLAQAVAQAKA